MYVICNETKDEMKVISKRKTKSILRNIVKGEASKSSCDEYKRLYEHLYEQFFEVIVKMLSKEILIEFVKYNELRKFHGLEPNRRLKGEIVKKAGENLYKSLSESINKDPSDFKSGELGERNKDTSLQEAIEVA